MPLENTLNIGNMSSTRLGLKSLISIVFCFWLPMSAAAESRSYDPSILQHGRAVFQTHCAVCHGENAESTVEDWHKPDAQGKYPPPPLNGTAHTWHHPINQLFYTIRNGTVDIGGSMPAWKDKISDEEIFSVIIWLTSLWPDQIYEAWMELNNQK